MLYLHIGGNYEKYFHVGNNGNHYFACVIKSKETAIFPAIAAVGGMLAPALIYVAFNANDPEAISGWAIPAATDIAFALGIMALLGKRVPVSLKVFLLALAIIDDLGVVVIIALFYTGDLSTMALLVGFIMTGVLFMLNAKEVTKLTPYMIVGAILAAPVIIVLIGLLRISKQADSRVPLQVSSKTRSASRH